MWFETRHQELVRGVSLSELSVDEAYLNVTSTLNHSSWLYALPDNCHQCPYSLLTSLNAGQTHITKLSTQHSWSFRVLRENAGAFLRSSEKSVSLCDVHDIDDLGEFGVYDLLIQESRTAGAVECRTFMISEPVNIYLPLVLIILLVVSASSLYKIIYVVSEKVKTKGSDLNLELEDARPKQEKDKDTSKRRIMSLDTFRGMSILLMIFVNDGAGGYAVLEHVTWNGLQLADVVFPWFLWIMGVCIPISIKSQIKRGTTRLSMLRAVLKRSCILFALGVMLNTLGAGPKLETLRIFGVLQRFGVLYLVVAALCAVLWPRNTQEAGRMCDVQTLLPQWIVHLALHCAHLVTIFLLQVPGCPTGYLGPGGISEEGLHRNCTGGATGYIDRLILGKDHLYQNPSSNIVYKAGPFDPEGPYGCLPSLLTVMLGVQAGATLLNFPTWQQKAQRWAIWGAACLLLAAPLAASALHHMIEVVPILAIIDYTAYTIGRSTSFVLVTAGMAFFGLTLCFLLIDVFQYWSGAPFLYPGMNATLLYVGHMVAYKLWPWHWHIGRMDTHLWLLLENLWGVVAWTFVAFKLYTQKFFLSI